MAMGSRACEEKFADRVWRWQKIKNIIRTRIRCAAYVEFGTGVAGKDKMEQQPFGTSGDDFWGKMKLTG